MSANQFHIVEGASVVLRHKGLFRQAKVYHLGGALFAGHGSGFVSLSGKDGTSLPGVSYSHLEMPPGVKTGREGTYGAVRVVS